MIGFVVIGRNEGERLRRCLASAPGCGDRLVYVDSGSTDASLAVAEAAGADIVPLERPFTAARARNAGFKRLIARWPEVDLVMFIDGDCELSGGFPAQAEATLRAHPTMAVAVGRIRERHRDRSIYNRLCDLEWAGPTGEIRACSGRFMVRRSAFESVGGFDEAVIAAEDDELCIRLRARGWTIFRLAEDMCTHDAEMTRFGQWWRRAFRAGSAYEQVGSMHAGYFAAERARAVLWALALPVLALGGAPFTSGASLIALGLYPASYWRTRRNLLRQGTDRADADLYAAFLSLSKFPNLLGMLDYRRKRLTRRAIGIIEYK